MPDIPQRYLAPSGHVGSLFGATLALLLTACGGASPVDRHTDAMEETRYARPAFEWRNGDERSFIAHRRDHEVIRCWNVQGKYDCLVAQSLGMKDVIPGAPEKIGFFRFRAAALPATQDDLDRLATSDGYACELTGLPGKAMMTEYYWQSGRIARRHNSDRGGDDRWNAADVSQFASTDGAKDVRPFFACPAVIDAVLDVGLYALDSGLINYDDVFATVDYPAEAKEPAPTSDGSEASAL